MPLSRRLKENVANRDN